MRRFDSDPRLQNPEIRELVFSEAFYARLVLRRGGILRCHYPVGKAARLGPIKGLIRNFNSGLKC
jgi:hypothetical protein